ncbi:MAG TPA: hypothetical protein VLI90_19620 [Tepidisphaeraceae bacterium]|nr:hypothetical protein [Tepidisphaeraceae bacterium]
MSQQWKESTTGGDDDVQMPLGVGGDITPPEEYSESKGPRFNSSTLTLVAAFATAMGVLYLLGLQNKPRTASAEDDKVRQKIDERIQELVRSKTGQDGAGKRGTAWLIEMLNRYFEASNKVVDLSRNPFEHEVTATVAEPPPGPREGPVLPPAASKELLDATMAYQGFRLQMVMTGSNPAALVSDSGTDQMVKVGSHLKMWEVLSIDPGRLVLRFKDVNGKPTDVELKPNAVPLSNKH